MNEQLDYYFKKVLNELGMNCNEYECLPTHLVNWLHFTFFLKKNYKKNGCKSKLKSHFTLENHLAVFFFPLPSFKQLTII